MLTFRSVYFHELLGLGPIWLHRDVQKIDENTTSKYHKSVSDNAPDFPPKIIEPSSVIHSTEKNLEEISLHQQQLITRLAIHYCSENNIALITTRPSLNTSAEDLFDSNFGRLIKHIMRTFHLPIKSWKSIEDYSTWRDNFSPNRVIVFGEDLVNLMPKNVDILALPYPAYILRNSKIKKEIWQKLKNFLKLQLES